MSESEPLQESELMPGHVTIGRVIDLHFHVADIVHGGVSEVAVTGRRLA